VRSLWSDVVLSLRLLVKNPAFSAGAVLSLALAVGANTAVFSLVDGILLRPPPVAQPDRLVSLHAVDPEGGGFHSLSYLDYRDLADGATAFADVLAYDLTPLAWSAGERAEVVQGYVVSPNFFSLLGVDAALGRTFAAGEGGRVEGGDAVVVLGHDLWQRRFRGDAGVIGTTIELNGTGLTVVGVAPPGFDGPFNGLAADLFVPLTMRRQLHVGEDLADRRLVWLDLIARLAPGVTPRQAQASVDVVVRHMLHRPGVAPHGLGGVAVRPLSPVPPALQRPVTLFLTLLLAITGTLLFAAGLNVAGMLLARAVARRKEIAIRLAIGATRRRLVRQLVVESLVLFLLAGAVGVGLAQGAVVALPKLLAPLLTSLSLPLDLAVRLDGRVLLFTLALSLASGALFGLAPLLQTARPALVPALQTTAGGVGGGSRKAPLRSALVVAQLAVSLLLLVVAGVLSLSLRRSATIDPGFDAEGVWVASLDLSRHGYDEARGRALFDRLAERIAGLPGVAGASLASTLPLGLVHQSTAVSAEGLEHAVGSDQAAVAPGYFRLLGIPLLAGRDFTATDRDGATPVVIVNRTLARHLWGDASPLGETLWDGEVGRGEPLRVVGVAADSSQRQIGEEPRFFLYRPFAQTHHTEMWLLARLDGPPAGLTAAIRDAVVAQDASLPFVQVAPLRAHLGLSLLPQRIAAALATFLAAMGLVLVAVGIYALMVYSVGQRVREVGIRRALGAEAGSVSRLMMRRGVALTATGLAIGTGLALLAGRVLTALFQGAGAALPAVLPAACAFLAAVALLAAYLPARSAARITPADALRRP